VIDDPFMTVTQAREMPKVKEFGRRGDNQRYHMPLLPDDPIGPPKSIKGADWVKGGLQSMTNLVGAFEDTRALSIWEQSLAFIGLALSPEMYEELVLIVHKAQREGTDFSRLRNYPELKELLAGHSFDAAKQKQSLIGRAKTAARAHAPAQRGTNQHEAWEARGATGALIGTAGMQNMVLETERLLAEAGLERVPGMSERCVRNVEINAAGRFDDILREVRTGRLLMADLKTKATEFYSFMTVDAQLAGYAYAEYMLSADGSTYEFGPIELGVDLTEGVVLHVPADGAPAMLRRADLAQGWQTAKLARQIVEHRGQGKNAERFRNSIWAPRTS
jgi:hypothetical protein